MPGRSWSIPVFCNRHGMKKSSYYNLKKRGLAPREMKIGRLKRISEEAEIAWQRRMEEIAETEAKGGAAG